MNSITRVGGMLLLVLLLSACQFPGGSIQPGDKVGNTEFISEYEQCQAPNFNEICGGTEIGFLKLEEGTCEIPAELTKFWISTSWQEDTQEALEEAWKDSEWKMTYDGQPVDLQAFGTFDWEVDGKPTRSWNVCISNPTPGEHTVVYTVHFEHGSRPGNHTGTFTFAVLPAEPTQAP